MSRSIMRGPSVRDEAVVKGSLEATVEQRLFIFAFPARPLHVSAKESAGYIQAHIQPKAEHVITTATEVTGNIKICSQKHGKLKRLVQHKARLSLRPVQRPVFK